MKVFPATHIEDTFVVLRVQVEHASGPNNEVIYVGSARTHFNRVDDAPGGVSC